MTGLLSTFLSELTKYDQKHLQFTVNELGFEFIKEIAIMCVKNMNNLSDKDWDFLTNGTYFNVY